MSFLDYDNKAKDEGHTLGGGGQGHSNENKHHQNTRPRGVGGIRKGEGSLLLEKNVREKLF